MFFSKEMQLLCRSDSARGIFGKTLSFRPVPKLPANAADASIGKMFQRFVIRLNTDDSTRRGALVARAI